jgi:hypothetical protein
MKKYLNKHQPNNILNYLDAKRGLDGSFTDWYESDIRNSKNPIYSLIYGVILVKPKIQFWVQKKAFEAAYSFDSFVRRFKR